MKTADLISSYLNNEMTPEQERQFLLSVAASDSLRLALKSHVMLDKIMANQERETHVPESVRTTIFATMSAAMAETSPNDPLAGSRDGGSRAGSGRMFGGTLWRFGRGALVGLLTVGGFAAGYFTHYELEAADAKIGTAQVQQAPAVTRSAPASVPLPIAEEPRTATAELPAAERPSAEPSHDQASQPLASREGRTVGARIAKSPAGSQVRNTPTVSSSAATREIKSANAADPSSRTSAEHVASAPTVKTPVDTSGRTVSAPQQVGVQAVIKKSTDAKPKDN